MYTTKVHRFSCFSFNFSADLLAETVILSILRCESSFFSYDADIKFYISTFLDTIVPGCDSHVCSSMMVDTRT